MADEISRDRAGVDALDTEEKIGRDDFLRRDRLLKALLTWADPTSGRGLFRLALFIVVPLVIMSVVTAMEGRFFFGSVQGKPEAEAVEGVVVDMALVRGPAADEGSDGEEVETSARLQMKDLEVRGMSFLGDTMVWPYAILLPILLVLLNNAIFRFEQFHGSARNVLSAKWLREHPDKYADIVERTREVITGAGVWQVFRWLAIFAGLTFFAWNTITCTKADEYEPYKTSAPYVRIDNQWVHIPKEAIVDLSAETTQAPEGRVESRSDGPVAASNVHPDIPVPKWDCEIDKGPLSWAVARLWVLLIGYVWIPLVLFKLFNLVAATYVYTNSLSKYEDAFDIKPLSPDEAGGLSKLSNLAVALTYPMVVVGLMMAMPFFKENTNISPHNLVLFIPFVPIFFAVFFMPLLGVHWAMASAKEKYLEEFADLFDTVHEKFIEEVRAPKLEVDEFTRLEISMRGLTESYDKISKMPVWPFETSTIYRLITAVLIPIVLPLLIDIGIGALLQ